MTKISSPILDEPIEILDATILTVEDVTAFSSLVRQFYSYSEECDLRLFDGKLRSLKVSELFLVTDILGFDINSQSILRLIHANLESRLNDKSEAKSMIEQLANTITELLSYECLESELDLECDEITISEFIKALGVKIETQSDTTFERCPRTFQIYNYLSKKKLLIFVNSGVYLTKNEIKKLIEYIKLSNQKVILLEPRRFYDFSQYILDSDYFLIAENMNQVRIKRYLPEK